MTFCILYSVWPSLDGPPRPRREPVFVVPMNMSLSISQMTAMIEAGQQPGVPFYIGGNGAERPRGVRAKLKYSKNLVSMRPQSVKLIDEGEDRYAVSFMYDAEVPADLVIYIGAKDRSRGANVRYDSKTIK